MSITSQQFESYLTVSDVIPSNWPEAIPVLMEQLKKIADAVNRREIGWLLDEEYLSGQSFIPGTVQPNSFRSVLRKVVDCSPLSIGANAIAHGITINSNFTLLGLYGAATNPLAYTSQPLPTDVDSLTLDATNVNITVAAAWSRAYVVITYIQEL